VLGPSQNVQVCGGDGDQHSDPGPDFRMFRHSEIRQNVYGQDYKTNYIRTCLKFLGKVTFAPKVDLILVVILGNIRIQNSIADFLLLPYRPKVTFLQYNYRRVNFNYLF